MASNNVSDVKFIYLLTTNRLDASKFIEEVPNEEKLSDEGEYNLRNPRGTIGSKVRVKFIIIQNTNEIMDNQNETCSKGIMILLSSDEQENSVPTHLSNLNQLSFQGPVAIYFSSQVRHDLLDFNVVKKSNLKVSLFKKPKYSDNLLSQEVCIQFTT